MQALSAIQATSGAMWTRLRMFLALAIVLELETAGFVNRSMRMDSSPGLSKC